MASFSFDIVSEIDKAEMNNVFMQAEKKSKGVMILRGRARQLIGWTIRKV